MRRLLLEALGKFGPRRTFTRSRSSSSRLLRRHAVGRASPDRLLRLVELRLAQPDVDEVVHARAGEGRVTRFSAQFRKLVRGAFEVARL